MTLVTHARDNSFPWSAPLVTLVTLVTMRRAFDDSRNTYEKKDVDVVFIYTRGRRRCRCMRSTRHERHARHDRSRRAQRSVTSTSSRPSRAVCLHAPWAEDRLSAAATPSEL